MKKIMFISVFIMFALLNFSNTAHAFFLVDTGAGNAGAPGRVADEKYWLASEIILSETTTITDIYHWQFIFGNGAPNRAIDLAIYGDGGNIPNTLDEIYRTSYSIAQTSVTDWYGASNLNWTLAPGEYWVALEPFINVSPPDNLFRFSTLPFGSPIPLTNNASAFQGNYQNWSAIHNKPFEYGLRVSGSTVPEPATLVLFGTGLLGSFLRKKFTV